MLKKLAILMATTAMITSPVLAAESKLKVGMITTLSGGGSSLGIDVRDGFMLAIKGNDNIEVVVEDDQRKPNVAVQLASKMIQSDKVDILTGIIWTNLMMAVAPAAANQNKFYVSPNAGPSIFAGKGCHKNIFTVSWQGDNLPEAGGAYANGEGYKNSFILAPNYPAGKDMLAGYKRFFKGAISKEVYTKLGQKDYAVEIAQIRASGADSVYFFLPGGMGISFMKQWAQAGIDLPIAGPAFSFDQGILGAIGESALGVKNTSHWNKDIDNPANNKFVADFKAEFKRLPSLYASQGYDTGKLLISAMGKADVKDMDAFRTALESADFDSTRGKFSFGKSHFPIQDIFVREVVKEGDVITNKILATVLTDHSNAYVDQCKM